MDWFLSISTWFVNSGLGWFKGKPWIWGVHAANAAVWIFYAVTIEEYGLIPLSLVTIVTDVVSGYRSWRAERKARREQAKGLEAYLSKIAPEKSDA